MRRRFIYAAGCLLVLVFVVELITTVRQQSLSWDEGDHIFAGYQAWKQADFGINPEHPPLVKEIAALPLLDMGLKTPTPKGLSSFKAEAYFDGRDLIYDNGGEAVADHIIFRARMAAATLSVLLVILVFIAASEMFGGAAGLFALAVIVFEPNLIAHGAYVTTDAGVSCFIFASIYSLYRYMKKPSMQRLLILGLAAGLALASKHSGVLLAPIALGIALLELAMPAAGVSRKETAVRFAKAFSVATVLAVIVLWSTYGFRFSARPGGGHMKPSLAEYAQRLHGIEPKVYLFLARCHVLPESYLFGMVDVRRLSESFPTYIFGRVYAHGVYYYFPATFIIKSTIGFLALLLLAVFALATRKLRGRREIIYLTVPPFIYFLIAVGTGLNIGARHILPIYPFLAVLIGGAAIALSRLDRRWAYATGILLAFHAVSSLRAWPHYIAYSNEFWGGPANTYKYLTDSNTDWGQQLKVVKRYLDERHITNCWFGYFAAPGIPYEAYGIPCKPLPTADTMWMHTQVDTPPVISGTVLISAGALSGYEFGSVALSPFQPFMKAKPMAFIDDGVFVFQGTFDTRFASALGHVTRARQLAAAKQWQNALTEAQLAVATDPDVLQAQMILGSVLMALNRKSDAANAYEKALSIAHTMEPSAQADWIPRIEDELKLAAA